MVPFVVKSGNSSCKMCRIRMTDFRPSNSASKEERQVLPDVVAFAHTAPDLRPRATIDPRMLRRRGPVAKDASVLLSIDMGDVPPRTRGKSLVLYKYPRQ